MCFHQGQHELPAVALLFRAEIVEQSFGAQPFEERQDSAKPDVLVGALGELFEPLVIEELVSRSLHFFDRRWANGLVLGEALSQIEHGDGSSENAFVELPDAGVNQIAETLRRFGGIRCQRDNLPHRIESGAGRQRRR